MQLERLLAEHRDCVFHLGAGHSVYDGELLDRAAHALAPFRNVVLLLPSPDPEESIRTLRERRPEVTKGEVDFVDFFVRHPANVRLAKWVVYTRGKTPGETADEVITLATPPQYRS